MKRLGISIYPEKSTQEQDFAYMALAAKYGFTRLFTCFLSVDMEKEELFETFLPITTYAKELGFEIYVDVYPDFFEKMNISIEDLSFFADLHVDGLRLDRTMSGLEESLMSYNPYGLNIELNMSNDISYIDTIVDYKPDMEHIVGCHNFYPQAFSGLSEEHFIASTNRYKRHNVKTAAFVTAQDYDTFGPWDISEGQPTLEAHRHLPIDVQAKALWAGSEIDDIIIGNAYASEAELKALSNINPALVNLSIELAPGISDVEKKIIFDELHFQRGDVSAFMVRSTRSRGKYKHETIEPINTTKIHRGDVLIANHEYGIYAAELQIALCDRENDGQWNVVGKVVENEQFLLEYITAWRKFVFIKA